MDVGEGGVAGIDARRQQRRHLLNLGTLADEHHTLARGCPAVRKVEEDGCLAAAHQSRLSRRMVACAGVKNRKRCSDKACAACTARCRMLLTAWESAALLRAKIVYAYEIIELHLRTGPVTRQCSKCAGKAGRFCRSACKCTSCPADKKSLRCRTMPNPLLGPLGCEPQLRC